MESTQRKFIGKFDQSMLEDIGEFEKRYSGTYLYIKQGNGEPELFYCRGYSNDMKAFIFENESSGGISLSHYTQAELEVRWPIPRLFNFEEGFLHVYRIPERQWKRAPCVKTVKIASPIKSFWNKEETLLSITENRLQQAINPNETKFLLLEAINSFKKSKVFGRALNDTFAVSLPPGKSGKYLLWYYNTPVAWVDPSEGTIEVKYQHLLQEIQDFNKYHEENKWMLH